MAGKTKAELLEEIAQLHQKLTRAEENPYDTLATLSRGQLQAVLSSSLDPMITIGFDGMIESASDSVERVFGWSAQQLIGQKINVLLPEPHRTEHDQYLENYRRTGKTHILGQPREFSAVRKNGDEFPCEITVWRVDLPDREQPVFTGIIRDISERKRSEAVLRESREWLSTTLTSIGDGVIAADANGNVTFMNPVAQRLTGWDSDAIGQPLDDVFCIVNEHSRERVESPVAKVLREGQIVGLANHTALIARNGVEYNIADSGSPIRDIEGNITGVVLVFRDVTDIIQAERQTRKHRDELAHVSRLNTTGELATGLAHELNQPLSGIAAYATSCLRILRADPQTSATKQVLEILEKVESEAQRAGAIIRRLRRLVTKRGSYRSAVDINETIREVMLLIESQVMLHGISVQLELDSPLPNVMIDAIQVEQVVLNFLQNAIEAMSETPVAERVLTIKTSMSSNAGVEVAVSDTGVGLKSDDLDKPFDAFYTTKTEGLGIGLSISRSIIEAHEGQISVLPNAQRGVTFRFTLPLQQDEK